MLILMLMLTLMMLMLGKICGSWHWTLRLAYIIGLPPYCHDDDGGDDDDGGGDDEDGGGDDDDDDGDDDDGDFYDGDLTRSVSISEYKNVKT